MTMVWSYSGGQPCTLCQQAMTRFVPPGCTLQLSMYVLLVPFDISNGTVSCKGVPDRNNKSGSVKPVSAFLTQYCENSYSYRQMENTARCMISNELLIHSESAWGILAT